MRTGERFTSRGDRRAGPQAGRVPVSLRAVLAGLIGAGLLFGAWRLSWEPGQQPARLSLTSGRLRLLAATVALLLLLPVARTDRPARTRAGRWGARGLAVGTVGYSVVLGAWLPDPGGPRLAPDRAYRSRRADPRPGGGGVRGGMAISGSCIGAHLYRLGEGSPTAPFALLGTASASSSVSPPGTALSRQHFGGAGALAAAPPRLCGQPDPHLGVWPLALAAPAPAAAAETGLPKAVDPLRAVFVKRWPTWLGGLAVGAIGTMAICGWGRSGYRRDRGSQRRRRRAAAFCGAQGRARRLSRLRHGDPGRLCDTNGLFVAGLVIASFAAALAADEFRPARRAGTRRARPPRGAPPRLGRDDRARCSVGTLLSGIMAGGVSGGFSVLRCSRA